MNQIRHHHLRRLPPMLWLTLALGCGPSESANDAGEGESGTGSEGEEWEDGRTIVMTWDPPVRPRVDMVMVVDDSPSMRAHQQAMAYNAMVFGEVLSADDVDADVRVAITTTSVPDPTCTGPRARGGEIITESCRAHLEDFVGVDEHGEAGGGTQDLSDACTSQCSLDTIERVPSPGSHPDGELALRAWIEAPHNHYGGNLADGDSFVEALGCAVMQGFAGCRFESPFEAAARMVERMRDPNDELFGFRRTDAALFITFITDEDDCSRPDSSATIFDPNGDRVFWPAGASEPLSAICVNAGLECDADGCALTDHDLGGAPTSDPNAAVLHGPERLIDALTDAGEFLLDPLVPVVSVVGGYNTSGAAVYAQPEPGSADEPFADAFGIGPGCKAASGRAAAPGGRLAELTALVNSNGATTSICSDDWAALFGPIAQTIKNQIQPACFVDACFADLDPATALLEPDCVMELVASDAERTDVPACERDAEAWRIDPDTQDYQLPTDADACWIWLTDTTGASADPYDDMDAECSDDGRPGQFKITRRAGTYLPYDVHFELRCRPCE